MKKVYLSVPMVDKDIDEIIRRRERMLVVVIRWLNEYVKPVDSEFTTELYFPNRDAERLHTMSKADYVVFAEDWETDDLCKIEKLCAEKYTGNILVMQKEKEAIKNGE